MFTILNCLFLVVIVTIRFWFVNVSLLLVIIAFTSWATPPPPPRPWSAHIKFTLDGSIIFYSIQPVCTRFYPYNTKIAPHCSQFSPHWFYYKCSLWRNHPLLDCLCNRPNQNKKKEGKRREEKWRRTNAESDLNLFKRTHISFPEHSRSLKLMVWMDFFNFADTQILRGVIVPFGGFEI